MVVYGAVTFAELRFSVVFMPEMMLQDHNLDYSLRRYFVDEFHFRHVPMLSPGSVVLDLGGNKIRKRGQFNVECYDLSVVYANLSTSKCPDVQVDAANIPFPEQHFDVVICSELLEHVSEPVIVLREIYRVLRENGVVLICVPFLHRIHGDPYDYGRYTDYYWRENLNRLGFIDVEIEKQGLFWSVLVDMLRGLIYHYQTNGRNPRWSSVMWRVMTSLIGWGRRAALNRDMKLAQRQHTFFGSFTTGFGIRAVKC